MTRALLPDVTGTVDCDGAQIAWARYGSGQPAVLLLPTWEIADARIWKCQVPFLARTGTVLTFDPLGNGASDRPERIAAYDRRARVRHALAVLDAAGVDRAVVVGYCAAGDDLALAANHPDRVSALMLFAPDIEITDPPDPHMLDGIPEWPEFVERFFERVFTEPHSTKQIEDGLEWGLQTTPEVILRGLDAEWANGAEEAHELLGRITCPTLVVQGSEDAVVGGQRGAAAAALIPGAELLTFEGSGHGPNLRDPVRFNLELRRFAETQQPRERRWVRARSRPRRALYVSSPIGLGHAWRDVAIADELRKLHPDLQIDWLAQSPVTSVLEARGERIHPASRELASESTHIESESAEHDLHCFQAWRRMDEIMVANFMVFHDVAEADPYDLWIADEGWEVDYFLHENPELKNAAYCWLTDFVGWIPMPDGGDREAFLTADYNAEMIEQIARFPRLRDRSVFVGNPADIVPENFGPDLPAIRDWTERHYDFAGYVTGFDQRELADRAALRHELGYAPDELVCIATVGGSGVGGALLRKVIEAFPAAKERTPALRMIAVAGPRIDPASLEVPDGLEVRPYVHELYRHLAACDLAVVQGGLTTAMELTTSGRPFLYFPLAHHFEQNFHVRHRLERYGAGRCMDFESSTVEDIARAISEEIGRETHYQPVETDGAARAAALLAEML